MANECVNLNLEIAAAGLAARSGELPPAPRLLLSPNRVQPGQGRSMSVRVSQGQSRSVKVGRHLDARPPDGEPKKIIPAFAPI
jgi:hypothetical protein